MGSQDVSVKQHELIIQVRADVLDLLMWIDYPRVYQDVWWAEFQERLRKVGRWQDAVEVRGEG